MKDELKSHFKEMFGRNPEHLFFCPGRVNLIGEHIDYNGGKVMPCAISLGTYVAVATNEDAVLRFRCLNFSEILDIPVQSHFEKDGKAWYNYPLGVINEWIRRGGKVPGLDMLFYGDLPIAAGLSSSASIEVLMAFALKTMLQARISNPDIALMAQKVENEFVGVNCGIMDQFAVAMGKKHKAILLDCDSLEYDFLPVETGEYILAIINSRKQRSLSESKYNERFAECREALKRLNQELALKNLCDLDTTVFERHRHLINDPILEKRALHVISENERVKQARKALESGDLKQFGTLMYASHCSLRDLYEVTGKELDTIVAIAMDYDKCIGARMTGAGFGGCAIALIRQQSFDDFSGRLKKNYKDKIGYEPEIFASDIGDGVKEWVV